MDEVKFKGVRCTKTELWRAVLDISYEDSDRLAWHERRCPESADIKVMLRYDEGGNIVTAIFCVGCDRKLVPEPEAPAEGHKETS